MTDSFLFFPFSHVSETQLRTLEAFFPSFGWFPAASDPTGLSGLKQSMDRGRAVPVFSPRADMAAVERAFDQYRSWVRIHKGNERNLKVLLKDNPYFKQDTDIPSIKSQIRGSAGSGNASADPELYRRDLLFLRMARSWDEDDEMIGRRLRGVDQTRQRMMASLLGSDTISDPGASATEPDPGPDPGAMMTRERVQAWAGCMFQDWKPTMGSGHGTYYVTTSEAVLDHLETICTHVRNALDIDLIKVHENDCENKTRWQRRFAEQLAIAAGRGAGDQAHQIEMSEMEDGCSLEGYLRLRLFSGGEIHRLFEQSDKPVRVCLVGLT